MYCYLLYIGFGRCLIALVWVFCLLLTAVVLYLCFSFGLCLRACVVCLGVLILDFGFA